MSRCEWPHSLLPACFVTHAGGLFQRLSGGAFHRLARAGLLALLLLAGPLLGAEGGARKPVRVAYQEYNRQMMVDADNKPVAGYAFEYIQTIGTYAGWDVEYVPCDSFADSVKRLLSGNVDLIYEISRTEEREKEMLFPDEPMGIEYYYLYSSAENVSIAPDDFAALNGKTVGVTSGTTLPDVLKEWCRRKKVDFNVVEYESIPQKEADLLAGKIDLDLELSMLARSSLSAVEKVGSSAYYLVANKNRRDLVDDINSAMEIVLNNDLFYFSRLQEQYFSDTVLSRNLTLEETKWVETHGTLRVGYFNNYLPFSARDDAGRPVGACIDAVRDIVRLLKLDGKLAVEFVCFDNQDEGFKAVESGKIDLMLPAYISSSIRKKYHVVGGKSMASVESNLAYLSEYGDGKDRRLAVNRNNVMQYHYCHDLYPDSEIVYFDDIRGCLDGILDGEADGTFLNGFRSEALLKPAKYHSIRTVRAPKDFTLHMAFAEDNIGLMLLMNRGLTMLSPDFIDKASYPYLGPIYTPTTMDFIQDHLVPVIVVVAVVVGLSVALVGFRISNRKLSVINRSLVKSYETIDRQRRQESELRKQLEKQQEEILFALQTAQSANRAKTAFLSNMSHDIRTPMNAIIGFTELAAGNVGDTERVRECLATIARSSEHLLSLINDILDMSRIESGRMTLNEKPESLTDILRVLHDVVQPEIQAKRHHFSIETVDVRNERIRCDKMRLNQILLNLLSNAIKYTQPGGTISLRITRKPTSKSGYATFEFRCKDNGIGMEEAFAKTIFEPFVREESSTVSGISGTGLGMAITKNIVDMMGGQIDVRSKKGKGTEFIVTVDFKVVETPAEDTGTALPPSGETPAAPEAVGEEKVPSLRGKRILLADDNALNVRIGEIQFRKQGMVVDTAQNGQEAVEMVRKNGADAYDFVLMDVQMPVLDGYAATAQIRKLPGGDKLVVIAYSANAFEEDREKSLKAGMNGHIAKPLKIAEVLRELNRFTA